MPPPATSQNPPDFTDLSASAIPDLNHGAAMSISIICNDWQPMPVPSTVRAFAIGDVHGLSRALCIAFLEVARRAADGDPDHLIMLGDYIDCGRFSRGIIAQVI
jgi:hypothetical protein